MAKHPNHEQAVADAEALIAEKRKVLAVALGDAETWQNKAATLRRTLPERLLKLKHAGDEQGTSDAIAETKAAEERAAVEKAMEALATSELTEAENHLRRVKHGDLIKRAEKQAGKFCEVLREIDAHLKAACDLWPVAWEQRQRLVMGWPGGAVEQSGHPAFAEGSLLKGADLVKTIRASLYRYAGVEFVSAAVNATLPPSFPGSKPSHPLNMNRKANRTLKDAADHAEKYLTAVLEGRPWNP